MSSRAGSVRFGSEPMLGRDGGFLNIPFHFIFAQLIVVCGQPSHSSLAHIFCIVSSVCRASSLKHPIGRLPDLQRDFMGSFRQWNLPHKRLCGVDIMLLECTSKELLMCGTPVVRAIQTSPIKGMLYLMFKMQLQDATPSPIAVLLRSAHLPLYIQCHIADRLAYPRISTAR